MAAIKCRQRKYAEECEPLQPAQPAPDHPLLPTPEAEEQDSTDAAKDKNSTAQAPDSIKDKNSTAQASAVPDPLSGSAPSTPLVSDDDPLSAAVAALTLQDDHPYASVDDTFEPWEARRMNILSRYTTDEKLTIVSSFLGPGVAVKRDTTAKARLAELEDADDLQEMQNLSQQEYIQRIEMLKKELTSAWEQSARVKALKISIQCAKMLGDTGVMKFYPSQFVLITDILDSFGELVYDRLVAQSAQKPPGGGMARALPESFTPDMVPSAPKEVCKNWFFKIASIRELLPRILIETALLKNRRFLNLKSIETALTRLSNQAHGIADPLVAVYVRCYIARPLSSSLGVKAGMKVLPTFRDYLGPLIEACNSSFKQFGSRALQKKRDEQNVDMQTYVSLFVPAVDWIAQCLAYQASEETFQRMLSISSTSSERSLLLNAAMAAFPPEHIARNAMSFVDLINDMPSNGLGRHHLYRTLGFNLVTCPPAPEHRRDILNKVWKTIGQLDNISHYLSCVEVWIEYPVKFLGPRETNVLLRDLLGHLKDHGEGAEHHQQLLSIIYKILAHMKDYSVLFSMEEFSKLTGIFRKGDSRVEAAKTVLQAFARNPPSVLDDSVVVNALMYSAKVLHDSISATSFQDDVKQIGELIQMFVSVVNFGRNFEQMLNFYVDARGAFSNIDSVLVFLVHQTNKLMMRTRTIVNHKHNRKTAQFIRSCVSFTYITTPSISSIVEQLRLFLESATTALVNQAVSQAEALFAAFVSAFVEAPREIMVDGTLTPIDSYVRPLMSQFLSAILLLPDNPDEAPLAIFCSALDAIAAFEWQNPEDRTKLLTDCLVLSAAFAQKEYLYSLPDVDANDKLYAAAPKFLAYVAELSGRITELLVKSLEFAPQQVAVVFARFLFACDPKDKGSLEVLNKIRDFASSTHDTQIRDILSLGSKLGVKV